MEEPIIPLKIWYILREDIEYSSDRLFNIVINSVTEPFYDDEIRNEWLKNGKKTRKYMIYNINFLEELESIFIKNGISFKWIKDNTTFVGILVEPTRIVLSNLLNDCLTLKDFSKNRQSYMYV